MNLKPALCLHILLICGVPGVFAQAPTKQQPKTTVVAPAATVKPATAVAASSAKPTATTKAKTTVGPPAAVKTAATAQPTSTAPAGTKVEPKATKPAVKASTKTKAPRVSRSNSFVPPPPPSTPSFLADPAGLSLYYGAAMPLEFLSKENLKEKDKEISMQLNDAQRELDNKKRSVDQRRERAVNFESLFQEGVISRRELENAQNEASDSGSEIMRLESKVAELKSLKDRINKKLQAANPQSKSQKRKLIH